MMHVKKSNPFVAFVVFMFLINIAPGLSALDNVPNVVNYQGRVSVAGDPFTGTGLFKFALVDAAGSATFLSNDGTSTGGSEPTTSVSISVTDGIFSIGLGDESLPNMTAIPSDVFENNGVHLRIWFDDGIQGSERLEPDTKLTSVGYAQVAQKALNMDSTGTISGNIFNAQAIIAGSIRVDEIRTSPGALSELKISNAGGTQSLRLDPDGSQTNQELVLEHKAGYTFAMKARWNGYFLVGSSDTKNISFGANNRTGDLRIETNGDVIIGMNGNVGIGTASPQARLDIADFDGGGGKYLSVGNNAFLTDVDEADTTGIYGLQNNYRGGLRLGSGGGTIYGFNNNIGIGLGSPQGKLHIRDLGTAVDIYTSKGSSNGWAKDVLTVFGNPDAGFSTLDINSAHSGVTDRGLLRVHRGSQESLYVRMDGYVGIGTTSPQSALDVNGMTTTKILRVTGGSDLSEQFDINPAIDSKTVDAEEKVLEPGMVVSIEPDNPGQLIISKEAYDRKVGGIISGAGGIDTGMLMGQDGTLATGGMPVALTGRVYCKADASGGSIEPGDLLTSSSTPGHAMKATDYDEAQGAVIGKAMTTLDKGQELILVLVNL